MTAPIRHRTHAREKNCVHLNDLLTGHPITWVAPHDIVNAGYTHGAYPVGGPAYIHALVRAYQKAERGEGDWPPPIPCFTDGDEIKRCDGTHRSTAALRSGVLVMPIFLFPSNAAVLRAAIRGQMNVSERRLHDERLRAARYWLAADAAGSARLSATDRASYQATVAAADEDGL
jgi:hypothetical protein